MAQKRKRDGEVVRTIKTTTGCKWEIYKYQIGKVPQYGTRLISRNGKLIAGNTGFNAAQNAMKNINSVIKNSKI